MSGYRDTKQRPTDPTDLDKLTQANGLFADPELSRAREIMGEAIEHLQGRQKEAYFLVMREGRSLQETAELLRLSKAAVQVYITRAKGFIKGYCRAVAKKEGLI